MKKIYIFFLVCLVALATGCPKAVKTKPSTKFGRNDLVAQTNDYLANRQMAYYCAMSGHPVDYDAAQFRYSCGSKQSAGGAAAVTDADKIIAKRIRDEAVESGIMAVNSVYTDFVDDLNTGRAAGNFVADIVDLGTSATIGIVKGERSLQILGVALTAFRGGRKSADLNFFRE